MYYGWRGKIGLIFPAPGAAPEREFNKYAPEGVAIYTQRVLFEEVTPEGLKSMSDRVDEAAKLLSWAEPDVIVFCCTTGSLIGGYGFDQELVERIEKASGAKGMTTSTAVLQGLKAMGSRRLVVSTPYSDEVNAAEKKFLEDNGYEVLDIKGLGYLDPKMMPRTTIDMMHRLNKEVLKPEADTLFVSCTGLGIIDSVPMYESDSGLRTISSNQASIWAALRAIGIKDKLPLGRLFNY